MKKNERHIIVARVDNKPGVVSRISGLFTRRGYNIESLVTGMTADKNVYQMTVCVIGTSDEVGLLVRQLERISEVIEVHIGDSGLVTSELMFIKIKCGADRRVELLRVAEMLNCRVAGMTETDVVLEVTGDEVRLESATRTLETFGIEETIRSGIMAI